MIIFKQRFYAIDALWVLVFFKTSVNQNIIKKAGFRLLLNKHDNIYFISNKLSCKLVLIRISEMLNFKFMGPADCVKA